MFFLLLVINHFCDHWLCQASTKPQTRVAKADQLSQELEGCEQPLESASTHQSQSQALH